jgi:hypothetical protein
MVVKGPRPTTYGSCEQWAIRLEFVMQFTKVEQPILRKGEIKGENKEKIMS